MVVGSNPAGRSDSREPEVVETLGFFFVRPAGALSSGWKSRREEAMPIEAKRNCVRVTERGEEAWSEAAG